MDAEYGIQAPNVYFFQIEWFINSKVVENLVDSKKKYKQKESKKHKSKR